MSIFTPQQPTAARQPQPQSAQYTHQQEHATSSPPAGQSVYQHRQLTHTHQHVSRSPVSPHIDTIGRPSTSGSTASHVPSAPSLSVPTQRQRVPVTVLSAQNHVTAAIPRLNSENGTAEETPAEPVQEVIPTNGATSSIPATSTPLGTNAFATLDDSPFSSTPPSKRPRGRPRKWAREEDRRAAEAQRRRDKALAERYGIPLPPRPAGTFNAPPSVPGSEGSQSFPARIPYIYFDKDYGHHTPGTPAALTARDVLVNWLAGEGNWNRWSRWSVPERDTACRELKMVLEGHGMTERETLSIRQQITFLQRGAREARKFELEGPFRELTPAEQRKVSHLVDEGTTPHQALLKYRWPYYEKLKTVVAEEPIMAATTGTRDRLLSHEHDDLGHMDITMDLDNIHHSPSTAALANTTLGQALRSVEQWSGSQEPSEQDIADVTSRANQLLGTTPSSAPIINHTAGQSTRRPSVSANLPSSSKALTKREAEAWELEKQQIKQKLELEREDRRAKEKISQRELHLQSIKAFRELLHDGLTRNQAGRMVWESEWPDMRRQMDEEDD